MAEQYLLVCPACGRKTPVEAFQAGQRVACPCGATLDVPTLLELGRLDRAEPSEPLVLAGAWGLWQRLLIVGLLIVAAAALLALLTYAWRPTLVDMQKLPPRLAWRFWRELQQGLDSPPSPAEQAYVQKVRMYRLWWIVVAAIGAAGLVTVGIAIWVRAHQASAPHAAKSPLPEEGEEGLEA